MGLLLIILIVSLDASHVQCSRKDVTRDYNACAVGGMESNQNDQRCWAAVWAYSCYAYFHSDTEASKGGERIGDVSKSASSSAVEGSEAGQEMEFIEYSASRCGTLGFRMDLPSVQKTMARFVGGDSRTRGRSGKQVD